MYLEAATKHSTKALSRVFHIRPPIRFFFLYLPELSGQSSPVSKAERYLFSRAKERYRHEKLVIGYQGLEPGHPARMPFDAKSDHAFVSSIPDRRTALTNNEWISAMTTYLGIPDPNLALYSGRIFEDKRGIGRIQRIIDPYGHSLSLYMGKRHHKTTGHNHIVSVVLGLCRQVGATAQARMQVTGLFSSVIPAGHNRVRFESSVRLHHEGLVPDILLSSLASAPGARPLPELYDVKGIGVLRAGPFAYGHPDRCAPNEREAAVPAEYRALAAKADTKYCGTIPGEQGPVQRLLETGFAPVQGLCFGAFGDLGAGFNRLIGKIAVKGAEKPERFGCCHGPKKAEGVVAAWATRHIGRAVAKVVAGIRLAALAAVLNGEQEWDFAAAEQRGSTWAEYDVGSRAPLAGRQPSY